MNKNEIMIFKMFHKHTKMKEGSRLPAARIEKETGVKVNDLYEIGKTLEFSGLVELDSVVWGQIGGPANEAIAFHFILTKKGKNFIKDNPDI